VELRAFDFGETTSVRFVSIVMEKELPVSITLGLWRRAFDHRPPSPAIFDPLRAHQIRRLRDAVNSSTRFGTHERRYIRSVGYAIGRLLFRESYLSCFLQAAAIA